MFTFNLIGVNPERKSRPEIWGASGNPEHNYILTSQLCQTLAIYNYGLQHNGGHRSWRSPRDDFQSICKQQKNVLLEKTFQHLLELCRPMCSSIARQWNAVILCEKLLQYYGKL